MATGDTVIKIKRSETVGNIPTGLTAGELAVNIADQRVYIGDSSSNTVALFAGPSAEQPAGQDGQLNYMFNSGFSASNNLYFSGSTLGITGGITMSGDLNLGGNILLPEDGYIGIGGDTEKISFNGAGSGSSSIDIQGSVIDFGLGSGSILRSHGDTDTCLNFENDKHGTGNDGIELKQSNVVMVDVGPTYVDVAGVTFGAGGATFNNDVIVQGGITASGVIYGAGGGTFGGDVTVLGGITASGTVYVGDVLKFNDGTTMASLEHLTHGVESINGLDGAVDVTGSLFEVGGLSADAQGIIIHGGGITIGDDFAIHDGGMSGSGIINLDFGRYTVFRASHTSTPSVGIQSPSGQNESPFIVGNPGQDISNNFNNAIFAVQTDGTIRSGKSFTNVVHAHGISADAGATFGGNIVLPDDAFIGGGASDDRITFNTSGNRISIDSSETRISHLLHIKPAGGISCDGGATFGADVIVQGGVTASGTVYAGTGIKFSDGLTQGTSQTDIIGIHVHGGKGQLSTGTKGQRVVPYNCSVTEWTTTSSSTGDIAWAVSYGSYSDWPTTASVGGTQPTITDGYKNQSTSPDWTVTGFTAGTLLEFAITSVDGITSCNLALKIRRDG